MVHRIALILLIICKALQSVNAQSADNFDFFPANWRGDTSKFILESGMLRSNSEVTNDTFYISGSIIPAAEMEWNITVNLRFNTSSANYTDLYLMSDESDLKKSRNGVFVRIGGTRDELVLYSLHNGLLDTLVNGSDNISSGNNNWIRVRVLKSADNIFTMYAELNQSGSLQLEGQSDISYASVYTNAGLLIRQSTSSFYKKHYFDDWYAGIKRKDSLAPRLIAAHFNGTRALTLSFDERLSGDIADSCCSGINIGIVHVTVSEHELNLELDRDLQWPDSVGLLLRGVRDSVGNTMPDSSLYVRYIVPIAPHCKMLRITEVMSDPSPVVLLPEAEFIEITNLYHQPVQLKNLTISDPGRTAILPEYVLLPGEFLALHDTAFAGFFDGFGSSLGLATFPSLNNSGDTIWLKNVNGEICDELPYTLNLHTDKTKLDGGYSLELKDTSWHCSVMQNWATSEHVNGGTPGRSNSVIRSIADTLTPAVTGYEIIDDSNVQIHLSESLDTARFGHLIKVEVSGFPLKQFHYNDHQVPSLMIESEQVFNTGVRMSMIVSGLGDCSGNVSTQDSIIFYRPEEPLSGEIVINEMLFNPATGGADYIEIFNVSDKYLSLKRIKIANLDTGATFKNSFVFPIPVLNPRTYIVATTDSLQVVNAFTSGNARAIRNVKNLPTMNDDSGNLWLIHTDGWVIDSVRYSEKFHHELVEDPESKSLERLYPNMSGLLPSNWATASSTSGYGTPGLPNSQSEVWRQSEKEGPVHMISQIVSPDGDGYQDQLLWEVSGEYSGLSVNAFIYNHQGKFVKEICRNWIAGNENLLSWEGTDMDGNPVIPGVYVVYVEIWGGDGISLKVRYPVTVTFK